MAEKNEISLWEYAVDDVRKNIAKHGTRQGEICAAEWERNVAFDKAKLLAAARANNIDLEADDG